MSAARTIGAAAVGVATVAGTSIQVAEFCGVTFDGALGFLAGSSRVWLPVASFLLGLTIGWFASTAFRSRRSARLSVRIGGGAEGAEAAGHMPLDDLTPAELDLLMRVYESGSLHVGRENLQAAKALEAKGLVWRLGCEGETGQVIQQCDIVLADGVAKALGGE